MLVNQCPCKHHIIGFYRPDLGYALLCEVQRCIERLYSLDGKVSMKQLLQHLGRGAQCHGWISDCFFEKLPRRRLQRMVAANGIHDHVGVDERQVCDEPLAIDSPMSRRCSSQSGSRPCSLASQLSKNSLSSSSDRIRFLSPTLARRSAAALRSQALKDSLSATACRLKSATSSSESMTCTR